MRLSVTLWLALGWAAGCRDRPPGAEHRAAPHAPQQDAAVTPVERDAPAPRDAAVPGDTSPHFAAPQDAAAPGDGATAAAPGPIELAATVMAGPFATLAALCAAQRCPPPPSGEHPDPDGPPVPSCPEETPPEHIGLGMAGPPPPFIELFLQGIDCTTRRLDAPARYRVIARRADGFFVSRPVFMLGYNPKYCSEGFEASWERRSFGTAPAAVLSVTAHAECLSCAKQGSKTEAVDLIMAIADTKAAPVAFRALITGQRLHQHAEGGISSDNTCPELDRDLQLTETWLDDTLTLRGPQVWKRPVVEDDGSIRPGSFAEPFVASSAGSYRFVVPAVRKR